MTEEKEAQLSSNPTLSELFDFIAVDEGARALPITIRQDDNDTRLLLAIQGEHYQCSVLMAKIMSLIEELHDMQAQAENEPEPRIHTG